MLIVGGVGGTRFTTLIVLRELASYLAAQIPLQKKAQSSASEWHAAATANKVIVSVSLLASVAEPINSAIGLPFSNQVIASTVMSTSRGLQM